MGPVPSRSLFARGWWPEVSRISTLLRRSGGPVHPGKSWERRSASWVDVFGLAMRGGIGFTVSLPIGDLAFGTGTARGEHVKVGVLVGSLLAALIAAAVLRVRNRTYRRLAQPKRSTDQDGTPDVYAARTAPVSGAGDDRGGVNAAGLCRSFGAERAVDHVDLQVSPGQIHALVGLNGAGKTTLMRLVLGMLRPDRGTVTIFGHTVGDQNANLWARVGHMLDTAFGYPELTVRENLRCAALLRGMPDTTAAVNAGIADLRLSQWAERPAQALSTGSRQRLGLACAMLGDPDLLVLDEPTTPWTRPEWCWCELCCGQPLSEGQLSWYPATTWTRARIADQISVMHRGRIVGGLDPAGTDLERTFFDLVLAVDQVDGEAG